MDRFMGKQVIVTGGGSGIGREIALALVRAGARVTITDLRAERLERVVRELRDIHPECDYFEVDHSSLASTENFHREYFARWPAVDILCANAGVGLGGLFDETSLEDLQWAIGVNFWGVVYLLKLFGHDMIQRKSGSILITASAAGLMAVPSMAVYSASKYAVVGLGESLRAELKPFGVNVSVLCPGLINTNIVSDGRMRLDPGGVKGDNFERVEQRFRQRGAHPARVAADALSAIQNDRGIQPSAGVRIPWMIKRFSNRLYGWIMRKRWKRSPVFRSRFAPGSRTAPAAVSGQNHPGSR